MEKALYDDGVYVVTRALVSTPSRFYPLSHTTASIRRDPLWAAICFAILGGACLAIYGDLLQFHEQLMLVAMCMGALIVASNLTILRISGIGHSGAMIIGRTRRIRALYRAIRNARTVDPVRLEMT